MRAPPMGGRIPRLARWVARLAVLVVLTHQPTPTRALVLPTPRTLCLLYHKPRGLVTTHSDELCRRTVYDAVMPLLPPSLRDQRWHAVGRLDVNTTGLLLITNDGALVHHVTNPTAGSLEVAGSNSALAQLVSPPPASSPPASGSQRAGMMATDETSTTRLTTLPKTYRVTCGALGSEALDALRSGVELSGGLGMSGRAEVGLEEAPSRTTSRLRLTIREGKNRQVTMISTSDDPSTHSHSLMSTSEESILMGTLS